MNQCAVGCLLHFRRDNCMHISTPMQAPLPSQCLSKRSQLSTSSGELLHITSMLTNMHTTSLLTNMHITSTSLRPAACSLLDRPSQVVFEQITFPLCCALARWRYRWV